MPVVVQENAMTVTGRCSYRHGLALVWIMALAIQMLVVISPTQADPRVVTVGIYENAPKVFMDPSGKASGIFIDLIEDIAAREDWELHYLPGTWGEGLDRLKRGDIDLMPDVSHTAERERMFAFHTEPVLSDWFQVYARKNSGIKSVVDLAGKRIVVLERSVQQEAFERLIEGFEFETTLMALPDYQALFQCVAKREADAAVTNRFYGIMHARRFGLEDTSIVFNPTRLFFAAPLGRNEALLKAIDVHMVRMKQDPRSAYYQSLKKWTSETVSVILPVWLQILGVMGVAVLGLSLVGSLVLKAKVNQRTFELSEINRALKVSEQKYRELVTLANSIILRISRDGRITFLNEFGQSFFGYSKEEILGQSVLDTIVPATDRAGRDLAAMMEAIFTDPLKYEHNINENIRRNGERVWIDWRNKMVFDKKGQLKEILSVGLDITDHILAELEIHRLHTDLQRHAEDLEQRVAERTAELVDARDRAESADRLKSAFLATMSHELRTPLNSIIGFTGILLQGLAGGMNAEQNKQLGMVQASARHLLALINDVLDISKIEAGQLSVSFSTFDLAASIEKTVQLVRPLAEKKGIDLSVDIADDVADVSSDLRRLEQVILNLLNNALKFTEKGTVRLACRADRDHYVLSVTDSGIGIEPQDLPRLFQPFHQIDTGLSRKREGTGLGLSISKKLMGMMGGDIDVQSQWGRGSTFILRFPIKSGDRP